MNRIHGLALAAAASMVSSAAMAQPECVNNFYTYEGVRSTEELAMFLWTSDDPAIRELSDGTKASLVAHMIFREQIPIGMDGTDQSIQDLYASGSADAVLSAIFARPTFVHEYGQGPAVHLITQADFVSSYSSYVGATSYCTNCDIPRNCDPCCQVPGGGCCDYVAIADNQVFRLTDVSSCSAYTSPCAPDYNQDGFLNGDDFDGFVSAFELGDPASDYNHDGFPSGEDFDMYVADFEVGC